MLPSGPGSLGGTDDSETGDDLAGYALEDRVAAEKARALKEPGPSWRQWLYHTAFRGWYALGILIADANLIVFWIEAHSLLGGVLSLVAALYAEFVLYAYLWYRPSPDHPPARPFRRTWFRPREYGRWTPEADLVRSGYPIYTSGPEGPSPREFL
jgi:hypothetical protein